MESLSIADAEAMRDWMLVTFDEMVAAGFIDPPWSPSGELYDRLVGYYRVAMTPQDAAQASFATRH